MFDMKIVDLKVEVLSFVLLGECAFQHINVSARA